MSVWREGGCVCIATDRFQRVSSGSSSTTTSLFGSDSISLLWQCLDAHALLAEPNAVHRMYSNNYNHVPICSTWKRYTHYRTVANLCSLDLRVMSKIRYCALQDTFLHSRNCRPENRPRHFFSSPLPNSTQTLHSPSCTFLHGWDACVSTHS